METFDRHRNQAAEGSESIELSCVAKRDRLLNGGSSDEGIVIGVGESTGIRRFGQYSDADHLNGILTRTQFRDWKHGADQS